METPLPASTPSLGPRDLQRSPLTAPDAARNRRAAVADPVVGCGTFEELPGTNLGIEAERALGLLDIADRCVKRAVGLAASA